MSATFFRIAVGVLLCVMFGFTILIVGNHGNARPAQAKQKPDPLEQYCKTQSKILKQVLHLTVIKLEDRVATVPHVTWQNASKESRLLIRAAIGCHLYGTLSPRYPVKIIGLNGIDLD